MPHHRRPAAVQHVPQRRKVLPTSAHVLTARVSTARVSTAHVSTARVLTARVLDRSVMRSTLRPPTFSSAISRSTLLSTTLLVGAAASCNSFDPAPREGASTVRVTPTDERAPVSSSKPPAPVMGSNLRVLQNTPGTVLVSDADRDRVSFTAGSSVVHVATGDGSLPNRATEDAAGFVHVALRGTGELVMIHPTGSLVARNKVCQAPRGLDYDAANDELVVACAEGNLVRHSVNPIAYRTTRVIPTDVDVRDVVVQNERLYVSRLRSAEVLQYEGDAPVRRHVLPTVELDDSMIQTERAGSRFKATVAWKMVASPENDGVIVLHQRSLLNAVGDATGQGDDVAAPQGGSSYGGSDPQAGCSAIVQPAVSEIHSDGSVVTSDSIAGVVLAVDMVPRSNPGVRSDNQRHLVLAGAGLADPEAPVSTIVQLGSGGDEAVDGFGPLSFSGRSGVFAGGVLLHSTTQTNPKTGDVLVGCASMLEAFNESGGGPVVSVAEGTNNDVIALQREPNALLRGRDFVLNTSINLGGESAYDTGHELFHRDSGGGIACASCHPEAEDDGHVWNFASIGERKTQFLGIPLAQTAPFHWDGTLTDLDVLMDEVFVARMGGVFQSPQRVEALGTWVKTSEGAVAASTDGIDQADIDEAAAARGKALFESAQVGCATCHRGPAFTDNASHVVGTAGHERLQTPSLTRIALHPPFMHDGCAKTLRERFEPSCGGGDAHGKTSHLTDAQIDDLVAYMTTL